MKNIKKIFYMGILVLWVTSFSACSNDDTYDFPGDAYNRVYIMDKPSSYKIIQTPISTVSNLKFETSLKCTKKASSDIKATIEVDNSLIATYNEKNKTNYEAMPAAALTFENGTMNIPTGAMAAMDTCRISITDDASILASLQSKKGYLIPLRITKTEGGNSQMSTNYFSTYLIVTISEDNLNHDAVVGEITGTLVANQTGWSATTNGTVDSWYEPLETLFDGDITSYCSFRSISGSDDLNLDINMGKQFTFDAITLSYGYGSWGDYGSLSSGMMISISNDGTSWQSIGEIRKDSKFCVFYAPFTAQYIRLAQPKSDYNSIMAGGFNIYAK